MRKAHLGQIPWNKGKEVWYGSEKHPNWKGENAKYGTIHDWIYYNKTKPKKCEICKKIKELQWASKDHKYLRILKDYFALCRKCHYAYDKKHFDSHPKNKKTKTWKKRKQTK